MAEKFCKVGVQISIGNRKSSVVDPVSLGDESESVSGELTTVLLNVVDAIKSLPTVDGNYTRQNIVDAVCILFDLQPIPVEEENV
jgi:hypothetical protein